ncbi:MAG TPA: TolC family protein [Tepidisphaeraceae bacterium]|nr:TolC family protein [Tepidisphaeraceae bacterium]
MTFSTWRLTTLVAVLWLGGCQRGPDAPDVAGEASKLTGIADAIHFESQLPTNAPEAPPDVLTLTEASRLAVLRDAQIQAALAKVRAAQATARQARLLPNPLLNFVARFQEGGGDPIIEVALAEDLLAVLRRPYSIKASDASLRAAAADALASVLDVLGAVQSSYANLQAIEEELQILRRRKQVVDQLLQLTEGKQKAGEASRADVSMVQTQKVELDVEMEDLQSQAADERLTLTRLIGQPSGAAEWNIAPWQPPPDLGGAEQAWMSAAMQNRPELRAKEWELAALGAQRRGEKWAPLQGSDIGAHAERDVTWSVGPAVTVPLPIFDTGRAALDKLTAQEIGARHELTQRQRQVIEEVRRAYAGYKSALSTLRLADNQLLPLAQQRYEQAQSAYKAGETDLLRLLAAEEDLQDARKKLVDLHKRASLARIKLYRAAGGPGVIPTASSAPQTQPATRPSTRPHQDTP